VVVHSSSGCNLLRRPRAASGLRQQRRLPDHLRRCTLLAAWRSRRQIARLSDGRLKHRPHGWPVNAGTRLMLITLIAILRSTDLRVPIAVVASATVLIGYHRFHDAQLLWLGIPAIFVLTQPWVNITLQAPMPCSWCRAKQSPQRGQIAPASRSHRVSRNLVALRRRSPT
jgi:hypothetical protein